MVQDIQYLAGDEAAVGVQQDAAGEPQEKLVPNAPHGL